MEPTQPARHQAADHAAPQAAHHIVHTASGRQHRLPIDRDHFRSLLRYVDELCAIHGCDNTLTHAQTWARANDVAWAGLSRSLRALGGFCDCEVGMNVAESDA